MDLEMRDEGPFTGLLVDLGDCCHHSPSGFKYDYGADGTFNAEEAILDVFGGSYSRPTGFDPPASSFSNRVAPVPKPPTHSPAHIFRGDGGASSEAKNKEQQSIEAPQAKENRTGAESRFAEQKRSNGSFGNHHNNFSHGPPLASSSPFKQQFRSGGFGGATSTKNGFGGRAHGAHSSGFGAPSKSGPSTLGGFGEPPKNVIFGSPSGDCSGFGTKPPTASSGGFNVGRSESQPPANGSDSFSRFEIQKTSGFGGGSRGFDRAGGDGRGTGFGGSGFKSGGFETPGCDPTGFSSTPSNNGAPSYGFGGGARPASKSGFGGQPETGGFGGQSGGDGFGSPKSASGFKSGGFGGASGVRRGEKSQFGTGRHPSVLDGVGDFSTPKRPSFGGGQDRRFGRMSSGRGPYGPSGDFFAPLTGEGSRFGSIAKDDSVGAIVGRLVSPINDPFPNGGFGGASSDAVLSPNRPRSGRSGRGSGRGSSRRTGRRGGRGRDRSSPVGFSMDTETPKEEQMKDAVVPPKEPKEKAEAPSDFGAKRTAQNFGGDRQPTAETAPKRRRMSCRSCGRAGHLAASCYTQNKDTMRCYNCNQMGHLAVRCPLPRDPNRGRPRPRLPTSSTFAGTATETTTSQSQNASNEAEAPKVEGGAAQANNNPNAGVVGVGLMCKLMQDAGVRHEMQNANPDLHDDILVYMLKQLQM